MPDPMKAPWNIIMRSIPVLEHEIEVTRAYWAPLLEAAGQKALVTAIFAGTPSIRLSRKRLLTCAYPSPIQKCTEILMWGYPTGMRGTHHMTYLRNLGTISVAAASSAIWPVYYNTLHTIGNIGSSTISKLAYFHGHTFCGHQSLILDQRIIDVMARGNWRPLTMPGLSYNNVPSRYLEYLALMDRVAKGIGCTPDKIEFALFSMGRAFF